VWGVGIIRGFPRRPAVCRQGDTVRVCCRVARCASACFLQPRIRVYICTVSIDSCLTQSATAPTMALDSSGSSVLRRLLPVATIHQE
jgi:hypothetical protein